MARAVHIGLNAGEYEMQCDDVCFGTVAPLGFGGTGLDEERRGGHGESDAGLRGVVAADLVVMQTDSLFLDRSAGGGGAASSHSRVPRLLKHMLWAMSVGSPIERRASTQARRSAPTI
jgi:hypothetical protein